MACYIVLIPLSQNMMATGRITKRAVEAVPTPPGSSRSYLWDDQLKGFGVMVTATGSRSYLVQYRIGGRGAPTRRYTIGKHGSPWTADRARMRATDVLEMVRKRVDPLDAEKQQIQAAVAAKSTDQRLAFDAYAELFGQQYVDRKKLRSGDDIKSVFRRDLTPHFKAKPIGSIRRDEITSCLDEVVSRSPSASVKAHKWLRKLFLWAVDRGDIGASPMEGMAAPARDGERTRVLADNEIRAVWLGAADLGEPYTSFVHTLLLTGQRLREVAGMQWREVDLDKAAWVIPASRAKNGRDHLVPLSATVVDLLTSRFATKAKRVGPVFSTDGHKPINGFSKPKAKLDAAIARVLADDTPSELPMVQQWVFHDLRRTFQTNAQALGFPRDHIHAAVNHAAEGRRSGLARIYQLYDYQPEKTALMGSWARKVDSVVSGSRLDNVVTLEPKRA